MVFLENELMYGQTFDIDDNVLDEDYVLPIGKAKIMRQGKDITLVSHSIGVGFCMGAAELLAKEGISCEVVNLRSIRPLDVDTVNKSIMKTNHLITVEGTYKQCGKTRNSLSPKCREINYSIASLFRTNGTFTKFL